MSDYLQQIVTAKVKAQAKIKEFESYVELNCTPSNDGLFFDNDNKVTLFNIDIENILTTYYIYVELLLNIQKELKHEFENIPHGTHSTGVISDFKIWKDALEMRRKHKI